MCDGIQMGEVKGHVESQLHHTSHINCWPLDISEQLPSLCQPVWKNKLCQDIFPVKQLLDIFSTI